MKKLRFSKIVLLVLAILFFIGMNDIVCGINEYSIVNIVIESYAEGDNIEAEVMWYPKEDEYQEILEIKTYPEMTEKDNKLMFFIKDNYSINAKVKRKPQIVEIGKIDFPVSVKSEYLKSTESIDFNKEIVSIAREIGKGDLFEVVSKVGYWVNQNIKYDISTSKEIKKASWVLDHKIGVCDEMTNLFISMLRSLGIPAKFVSGVAYSDKWAPHSWAEVYFEIGDKGIWVPFDPTFGQLGYIDETHIKLMESLDPKEPSTRYLWQSGNVKVDTLNVKAELIEKGLPLKKEFEIELDVKYNKVGFGSDNRIIAKIKNLKNYYIARIIRISDVDGIEYLDEKSKLVILEPNEIEEIFWDVNVDELNENFIYTIPFEIMNKNVEFIAKDGERKYNIKKDYEKKDLILECDKHEIEFYEWENAEIKCWTNKETEICFENECIFGKEVIFEINKIEGRRSTSVKADDEFFPVIINMIGKPEIEIIGEYPEEIEYNDKFILELKVKEKGEPQDIWIKIRDKEWELKEILRIELYGSDLYNDIKVEANYKDKRGNEYNTEQLFKIKVKTSFWQKIKLKIKKLFWAIKP